MEIEKFNLLIGMNTDEASQYLLNNHKEYVLRVVKENGTYNMVTLDYRSRRINVGTENGVITELDGFY